jgi:hypothetical protein
MTLLNAQQHPLDAIADTLQIVNDKLAHLKISFQLVEKMGGYYIDFKDSSDDDDDLNEPLGTPSCILGEACESCQ